MRGGLPPMHLLLALLVAAVWGTNFSVIRIALDVIPPLTLACLRFALAVLPAIFFLPRPAVPQRDLALYGVLIGAGQFGLLYLAMDGQISPGLASLVVQTQVFFTIGIAMVSAGERLARLQIVALILAAAGLAVIALNSDAQTTPFGLAMVLAAALCWACANTIGRRAQGVNMLAYVVWASLYSVPPLLALALWREGPRAMLNALSNAGPGIWLAIEWQAVGNALFGFGVWAWLLQRHPAATVAPWALGVPVFGLASAALWLGEPLPGWKLAAAALVVAGLALNVAASKLR